MSRSPLLQSVVVLLLIAGSSPIMADVTYSAVVLGGGSTSAQPVCQSATTLYSFERPDVLIQYDGIGSTGGKQQISRGLIDFAGPPTAPDLRTLPTIATAIVPIYNVPGLNATTALALPRRTLVDIIFSGVIQRWDDHSIVAANPSIPPSLPDSPITVVVRADGSGTTNAFTAALSSFYPASISRSGNDLLVAAVLTTPLSISYTVLIDALDNSVGIAQTINANGKIVAADAQSIARAVADQTNNLKLNVTTSLTDSKGTGVWPITTMTYLVVRTANGTTDCNVKTEMLKFWIWFFTSPAVASVVDNYRMVPVPGAVRDLSVSALLLK